MQHTHTHTHTRAQFAYCEFSTFFYVLNWLSTRYWLDIQQDHFECDSGIKRSVWFNFEKNGEKQITNEESQFGNGAKEKFYFSHLIMKPCDQQRLLLVMELQICLRWTHMNF